MDLTTLGVEALQTAHDRWHLLDMPTVAQKAAHGALTAALEAAGAEVACAVTFDTKPLPDLHAAYMDSMIQLADMFGKWSPWEAAWMGPESSPYLAWMGAACAGCMFFDEGCRIVDVETAPAAGCRLGLMTPGFSDMFDMPYREAAKQAQVVKSAEERYTLGPWYIPDVTDAHGEWTDADELQQALWSYVKAGDRRIRLQHDRDVVAGEWVEAMSWPFPVTVPLMLPGEVDRSYTFPAGTVFLGVVWEPWAWDRVKSGEIRGFSIGGEAIRVDLPSPDASGPQ